MRLTGDMHAANSPAGIESLVDAPSLIAYGVDYTDRAVVDWYYFGYGGTYTDICVDDTNWWVYVPSAPVDHNVYGFTDCHALISGGSGGGTPSPSPSGGKIPKPAA